MLKAIVLILFVLGIILLPCLALVLLGSWVSRRLRKRAPGSQFLQRLTPLQVFLSAGLVAVFLAGTFVRQVYPQTSLGIVLNTPTGLFAASLIALVAYSLAHATLMVLFRRRAQ